MSLAPLTFKYIGNFLSPALTTSGTLAAINNAFRSTTYADGTTRITGSGIAWTPQTQVSASTITAVALTPVTSTLGQKMIYAGAGTNAGTMIGTEAWSANNRLFYGLCKNAGAFSTYSSSAPFTTGQFSGYLGAANATQVTNVHAYETQDSVFVMCETSTKAVYMSYGGAIIDPETSNASCAESDGKIYGLCSTGYALAGGISISAYANSTFLYYDGGAGGTKNFIMTFGTSSLVPTYRANGLGATTTTVLRNTANEYVQLPLYMMKNDGTTFYGRLREVLMFTQGLNNTKLVASSVTSGYVVGANSTTVGQAILLKA